MSKFIEIHLDELKASETNPRMELREIAELSESITAFGILQPLVVRKSGKSFTIIAGHRRAEAARQAGYTKVPCVVRTAAASDDLVSQLVENTAREDLLPAEIGVSVYDAIKGKLITQKQLAKTLGRSETWVSKFKTIGQAAEKVGIENGSAEEPNLSGTIFERERDAEKLYNKARAVLGLDKADDDGMGACEEGDGGDDAPAELEVIEDLRRLVMAETGLAGNQIEVLPHGKSGYKVQLTFKSEAKVRAHFASETQHELGLVEQAP